MEKSWKLAIYLESYAIFKNLIVLFQNEAVSKWHHKLNLKNIKCKTSNNPLLHHHHLCKIIHLYEATKHRKYENIADMPTSRHCFPGDLPPKSRRLGENPGDFNQPSICIRYKLFLTFYIPYFAGYKSRRSVSSTGHIHFFFFRFKSQIRCIWV